MPSLVNQILLSELEHAFESMGSCVVLDVGPVQPDQDIEIRGKLREAGVHYRVVRNRLASMAFAKMGLDMSVALKGRTGIAVAEKEGAIAAAKVLKAYITANKECPIAIKGGVVEGEAYVGDQAGVIAELPDRDTINTKIVSEISGPARSMASIFNAVAGGMARCIQAKVDKGE